MKIVLFADGLVGVSIANYLLEHYKDDLVSIICIQENDIYDLCISQNIPVLVYKNENNLSTYLNSISFDLGILAWWPKIISNNIITLSELGFINTHNSLLPSNRGKHPYFWTFIENCDYGVTIHWVDEGIDTGDIIAQKKITYDWEDTSDTIYKKSLKEMISLFCDEYPSIRLGNIKSYPQKGKGSFHFGSELSFYDQIDLEKSYKGRDLLNIIRARTTSSDKFKAVYFIDKNIKYRVNISIKKEESPE